jgi:hypothetical protein
MEVPFLSDASIVRFNCGRIKATEISNENGWLKEGASALPTLAPLRF